MTQTDLTTCKVEVSKGISELNNRHNKSLFFGERKPLLERDLFILTRLAQLIFDYRVDDSIYTWSLTNTLTVEEMKDIEKTINLYLNTNMDYTF